VHDENDENREQMSRYDGRRCCGVFAGRMRFRVNPGADANATSACERNTNHNDGISNPTACQSAERTAIAVANAAKSRH
jgi:hypothetical protein